VLVADEIHVCRPILAQEPFKRPRVDVRFVFASVVPTEPMNGHTRLSHRPTIGLRVVDDFIGTDVNGVVETPEHAQRSAIDLECQVSARRDAPVGTAWTKNKYESVSRCSSPFIALHACVEIVHFEANHRRTFAVGGMLEGQATGRLPQPMLLLPAVGPVPGETAPVFPLTGGVTGHGLPDRTPYRSPLRGLHRE